MYSKLKVFQLLFVVLLVFSFGNYGKCQITESTAEPDTTAEPEPDPTTPGAEPEPSTPEPEISTDSAEAMTTESTQRPPTTPKSTPGPNDLVLVDYIIIGVTCGVVVLVAIGGIFFAVRKSKSDQEDKDALYNKYLAHNEMEGVKEGVDNTAYVASSSERL